MYDKSDPRSQLATASNKPVGSLAPASYGLFYKDPPVENDANGKTWYTRGVNFVIAYTEAAAGGTFSVSNHPDEYMTILPDADTPATATAGAQTESTGGYSLLIMPPGDSTITLAKGGKMVRIFTTKSDEITARAANNADYAQPSPNVPPLQPWPNPVGGFKIRVYSLEVPPMEGRYGRIWRSTNLMINMPPRASGERDLAKLSPHHHDDFEQCSLALEGSWGHHMRWPWSIDMAEWQEDVHARVESPSVTVIPAQVIHTSTWHSEFNQLVDIFAPPRMDFSQKENWVLNADEYPMP